MSVACAVSTHQLATGADGNGSDPSPFSGGAMITPQGFALIAELVAVVLLIGALAGFIIQRSQPWLVGVAIAFMILIVAVTVVADSST